MEPFPENWQRAVAVVAHPDDLEYGMASAIARFTAAGKHVAYVLVTSGEAGIDGLSPERSAPASRGGTAPQRRGRRCRAGRILRPR
jgi:LmbE family N-acetylglucosaminyl deacetylase